MQGKVTGASSGAQEDAVKAEAKVQDLQGRLKLAEQDKAAAETAQKVNCHFFCRNLQSYYHWICVHPSHRCLFRKRK